MKTTAFQNFRIGLKYWITGIILILLITSCGIKEMYKPNCSTKAVNRALVAGEPTRIVMGMGTLEYGRKPGHIETQKLIDGEWYWLYDTWDGGVVAMEKVPEGFDPLFYFDMNMKKFIELEFFTDFPDLDAENMINTLNSR